jgi:hypothetical protein
MHDNFQSRNHLGSWCFADIYGGVVKVFWWGDGHGASSKDMAGVLVCWGILSVRSRGLSLLVTGDGEGGGLQ